MVDERRNPSTDALKQVHRKIADGDGKGALDLLRKLANPESDYVRQFQLFQCLKRISSQSLGLQPIRVAFLGSSTLEHFVDILKLWLAFEGFELVPYIARFNTLQQTITDPQSDLYAFSPELVWIATNWRDVRVSVEPGANQYTVIQAVGTAVEEWVNLWTILRSRSTATIFQNNADIPTEQVFGNLEGGVPWSRTNVLRRYNLELAAAAPDGVVIFDADTIAATYGKHRWFEARHWFHSKHAFSFDAYGLVSFRAARLIGSLRGKAKKCVVVDLDNTLWGGIIGDEGLEGIRIGEGAEGEAFLAFQSYLAELGTRGVVLAVCSKNDEDKAMEPFARHPNMKLRMNDFVAFVTNWNNKADNIAAIARSLNIGLDAIVYVDDNPAERAFVRQSLPEVIVPELPSDPADYVACMDGLRLFETVAVSKEDFARSRLYRQSALRQQHAQRFSDLSEFLRGLNMEATIGTVDNLHVGRMEQLISKTNQFNMTGKKFSQSELLLLNASPDHEIRYFKLADCFGDNGLVSVVILRQSGKDLIIESWVMSCRVFSRGLEQFIFQELCHIARIRSCDRIIGQYLPTVKNGVVADLYSRLGFDKPSTDEAGGVRWHYDMTMKKQGEPFFIQRAIAEAA